MVNSPQKALPMKKNQFTIDDLLQCGNGVLFGPGNAQLPLPPMLMLDRIKTIDDCGGTYGKGQIIAEFDIKEDLWFFGCHFKGDPVMPGCLGLDAMWQLIGFYLAWLGGLGHGRALGVGKVNFKGEVRPTDKIITYKINLKRIKTSKFYMGMADASMEVDDKPIYRAYDLKVGLFFSQ